MTYVYMISLCLVLAWGAAPCAAQNTTAATAPPRPVDQMFTLDMQPVLIERPKAIVESTLDVSEADLGSIIVDVLRATTGCGKDCKTDSGTYYLLHLIEHVPGKVDTRRQKWYTYFDGWAAGSKARSIGNWFRDPYASRHYREARLFGARKLTLLYVHYNVQKIADDAREQLVNELLEGTVFACAPPDDQALKSSAAVLQQRLSARHPQAEIDAFQKLNREHAGFEVAWSKLLASVRHKVRASVGGRDAEREQKVDQLLAGTVFECRSVASVQGTDKTADLLKERFGDEYLAPELQDLTTLSANAAARSALSDRVHGKVRAAVDTAFNNTLGRPAADLGITVQLSSSKGNELDAVAAGTAGGEDLGLIEKGYLPISYQIEITKKQPDNLRNLTDALTGIFMSGKAVFRAPLSRPDYALCGIQDGMQLLHRTSDLAVKGFRGQDEKRREIGTQTFDNEGRYWWDFSFAFPAKGVEDLRLDASQGTAPGVFTGRKIERKNVFATVNLFPVPVDTKRLGWRFIPQLMYGVGITKKPFDNQLIGVGIGTAIAQPFFGRMYSRTETLDEAGKPAFSRSWKWTWGVNLQPRGVLSVFKKAAGGS